MRRRLVTLLESWAAYELRRCSAKSMFIPADSYVWIKDKLGRYHFGSYDAFGRFVQGQASFTLIPVTGTRERAKLEEFGAAMRKLSEVDQGLIIIAALGQKPNWRAFLIEQKLKPRFADRLLYRAWIKLQSECSRRGIL